MNVKKLGDLCTIVSGGTPSRSCANYWNGTIPWIKISNIKSQYVDEADEYITEEGFKNSSAKMLSKGTILYSIFATLGDVGILNFDACTNQAIAGITIKDPNRLIKEYLYFYLKSRKSFVNHLGRGVAQNNINLSILRNFRIAIPSTAEQKHIVQILDQVSAIQAARQKQLRALDELVKARFIEMFGDLILNNKKWQTQPLGELCTIVRGGSPRPIEKFLGGNIPWIKIGDATKGENIYLYETKEHIIPEGVKKSRLVKAGSLIFANCGVSLGFARIIKFDGCIHDGWLAMEDIDSRLDKIFLLQSLNQMTSYFREMAPAGTQPNLNTEIMKSYRQIVPPIKLQSSYVSFLEQVNKTAQKIRESLTQTETLFNSLMQQYFG